MNLALAFLALALAFIVGGSFGQGAGPTVAVVAGCVFAVVGVLGLAVELDRKRGKR